MASSHGDRCSSSSSFHTTSIHPPTYLPDSVISTIRQRQAKKRNWQVKEEEPQDGLPAAAAACGKRHKHHMSARGESSTCRANRRAQVSYLPHRTRQ